jgi:hypothetical protein
MNIQNSYNEPEMLIKIVKKGHFYQTMRFKSVHRNMEMSALDDYRDWNRFLEPVLEPLRTLDFGGFQEPVLNGNLNFKRVPVR